MNTTFFHFVFYFRVGVFLIIRAMRERPRKIYGATAVLFQNQLKAK